MPVVEPIHSPTIAPMTAVEAAIFSAEKIGHRVRHAQLEEGFGPRGREHAEKLERLRVHRRKPAHHVDQRRKEADQRGDGDLRLHAVAEQQHENRRLGDDGHRVDQHDDRE